MSEQTYQSEQSPEERLADQDRELRQQVERALDDEKEAGHDGRERVADDDLNDMMEHL